MREIEKRFWSKVAISSDYRACWNWEGALNENGYGLFNIAHGQKRRSALAPRVAYMFRRGIISAQLRVCHLCDNPACVNPRHLFLGTMKDNYDDMRRKGRGSLPPRLIGEKNGSAKLSEDQVVAIWGASGRQRDIAKIFGISQGVVGKIKARQLWTHVTGVLP